MTAGQGRKQRRKRTPRQKATELVIEQRREEVAKLRVSGLTVRAIAAELGCSKSLVQLDLEHVFLRTQERADDAIRIERSISLERMETMSRVVAERAQKGDLEAIDRAIKLDQRRAKLLGLDAPQRQEHELMLKGEVFDLIEMARPFMKPETYVDFVAACEKVLAGVAADAATGAPAPEQRH